MIEIVNDCGERMWKRTAGVLIVNAMSDDAYTYDPSNAKSKSHRHTVLGAGEALFVHAKASDAANVVAFFGGFRARHICTELSSARLFRYNSSNQLYYGIAEFNHPGDRVVFSEPTSGDPVHSQLYWDGEELHEERLHDAFLQVA